jgi:hypothetical protein
MIANTQRFEQKYLQFNNWKELRLEFVDRRSQLMKLKMESTVSERWWKTNFPSTVPPINKSKSRREIF